MIEINTVNCRTRGPRAAVMSGAGGKQGSNESAEAVGSFIRAASNQAAAPTWAGAQRPQEAQGVEEGRKRGRTRHPRARPRLV